MKQLTREALDGLLLAFSDKERQMVAAWIERGDGVAVYRNADMGSPNVGHMQLASYGSAQALLEQPEPPERLPDIAGRPPNWGYVLEATYREQT